METPSENTENKRKRTSDPTRSELSIKPRGSKTICLPIDRESYAKFFVETDTFREFIDEMHGSYPELFPEAMAEGYTFHDILPPSRKLPEIRLRRIMIKADQEAYTIRPSFVLPYMTGYTNDVENALLLMDYAVPPWLVARVCGRNAMYWERLMERIGHNSVVGTTVRQPEALPEHLLADEKHTHLCGKKAYVATTVAKDCILGVAMSPTAGQADLQDAYSQFKTEAQNVKPEYEPQTVNTDGWKATIAAWGALFPTCVRILCFLHAFIKIRDRGKRLKQTFFTLSEMVWNAYHTVNREDFYAKVADLTVWALDNLADGPALDAVLKLCMNANLYAIAYDFPHAHRTSNMIDRNMNDMDRFLFASKGFHGHLMTAEYRIRGWALLHNFRPYSPRSELSGTYQSRAHRLNGYVYHDNWLHNLLVSSSMAGFRA